MGLRAWRAGENVETALTLAGYGRHVVDGVVNYIVRDPATAEREASGMTPFVTPKRLKTSGGSRKVPVAKNVRRYVKNCMERLSEKKFFNSSVSVALSNLAGTVVPVPLYSIVNGTFDTNRIGNIIHVKSVTSRLIYTDTVDCRVRVVLVWDKQPNGALANPVDVLESAGVNGNYNNNNVVGAGGERFVIVSDTVHNIQPTVSASSTAVVSVRRYTTKVSRSVTYNASTGAITDITSGMLLYVVIPSTITGGLDGRIQIEYDDN